MAITRKKANATLAKLRKQGVEFRLCPDPNEPRKEGEPTDPTPPVFRYRDKAGVLTQEQTAYLEAHRTELSDALFAQSIDEHYPDDFEPNGCFSRGSECLIFKEQDRDKLTLSLINKAAQKKAKQLTEEHQATGSDTTVEACGECDLFLAQKQIDEMRGERERREARARARDWANQQAHARNAAISEAEEETEE